MRRFAAGVAALSAFAGLLLIAKDASASSVLSARQDAREAATVTKDLVKDYGGVSGDTINRAIQDAKAHFRKRPDDRYVITIPPGVFNVAKTINVAGVGSPRGKGRLVIQGAGKNRTTLVTDPEQIGIRGKDTYRVSFIGMHFTLPEYSVSQGHVVSASPGEIVIDVPKGFPSPGAIMDDGWLACHRRDPANSRSACGPMRRYIRKYTDSRSDPQIVETNNRQIPWYMAEQALGGAGRWKIQLARPGKAAPYAVGDLVGLKSKEAANTYYLCGGSDFEFRDIRWTQRSRGKFRCGFTNVRISGSEILRAGPINGQAPVMSSPAGGPQIGHAGEATSRNIVENNVFVATGDDSIGIFSSDGTTIVRNNRIFDSFARGIFLYESRQVQLSGNTLVRNPLVYR
jgi:parallel beta-helix repeat protein